MTDNHCKICDWGEPDFNDEWYCQYWGELCADVEDCDSREVDGKQS